MSDVQFGRVVQEQVHGRENRAIVSLVLLSGESYGTRRAVRRVSKREDERELGDTED